MHTDPIEQFRLWFKAANDAGIKEANGMTLATVDPDGRPSARIVLLKDLVGNGFRFFTNYKSRKGRALSINAMAALVFWWRELGKQVRIEGEVEKLSKVESDRYFRSRPRGSQIAAAISPQSRSIKDRNNLTGRYQQLAKNNQGQEIQRPDEWGGYAVLADKIEFWENRPDRLHDRLRYTRRKDGSWRIEHLAP